MALNTAIRLLKHTDDPESIIQGLPTKKQKRCARGFHRRLADKSRNLRLLDLHRRSTRK